MSVSSEVGVAFKWWERLAQHSYQTKMEQSQTEKCLPQRVAEVVIRFFSLMPHGVFYAFWERYRNYYNSLDSDGSQRVNKNSEKEKSRLSVPIFTGLKVNAGEGKEKDLSVEGEAVVEISEKASTKKQEKANDLQSHLKFTKEERELLKNNPFPPGQGPLSKIARKRLEGNHPPLKISAQLQNTLNTLFKTLANDAHIQLNSPKILAQVMALYPLMAHDDDQKLIREWVTCLYLASEFALDLNEPKRLIFVENLRLLYLYWKEHAKDTFDIDKLLWVAFINVRQAWISKPKRHPVHIKLGITLDEVRALEASGFAKRKQWEINIQNLGIGDSACVVGPVGFVEEEIKVWEPALEIEEAVNKANTLIEEERKFAHQMWEVHDLEEKELLLSGVYCKEQCVKDGVEALLLQGEDRGMDELFEAIRLLFGVIPKSI